MNYYTMYNPAITNMKRGVSKPW